MYKRDIFFKILPYLDRDEAVLIIGPRQAGKTTVLRQLFDELKNNGKNVFFLNLEDPEILQLLKSSPKKLFEIIRVNEKQKNYVFIDEIQYLSYPSNFIKYFFDEYRGVIKLIASGSSAFYLDSQFKDSLVGRKKIFTLLTLSFKEFLNIKSETRLAHHLHALTLQEKDLLIPLFYEYAAFGGYPKVVLASLAEKEDVLRDLVYSYIKKDILEAGVQKNDVFFALLKMLAGQVGSQVNSIELANTLDVSKTAIANYLHIMQKTFHISLIKPFSRNIRKELTKMPKVFFTDIGIRNFMFGDFSQLPLHPHKGQILENIIFRQLLEETDLEDVKYWRTSGSSHEVDFIIREEKALEVKYDANRAEEKHFTKLLSGYPNIIPVIATMIKNNKQSISQIYPWEF